MTLDSEMRVVFLDAATFGRADVSFAAFEDRWSCRFYDETDRAQTLDRIAGHQVVVSNKVVLDADTLGHSDADALRLVAIAATGTNNVDLKAARARGVAVANVVGYSTQAVAQHTLALILELASRVGAYAQAVREGEWERSKHFALLKWPCQELSGKTLGLVGCGHIGRQVAHLARAFGMQVLVAARPGSRPDQLDPASVDPPRIGLEALLERVDVLSLHCPLTPENEAFIGAAELARMRRGALLVNTARGGLIDESALIEALESGHLGGAGLDVLSVEPPSAGQSLLEAARSLPQLVVTPHVAWAPVEARRRLLDELVLNIGAFEAGERRNRVD